VLHVGHRVVGVVLAGPERGAGARIVRRHHAADDGHADVRHQRVPAARVLHQGHRRVDWRVPDVRVRRTARVRTGQLRVPVGHAPGRHEQKVRPGAHRVHGRRRLRGRPEFIQYEAADAPRADDVPGQDEPDHPPGAADGEELMLEVVDVQVPHQVQAHRRHIPHTVPDGVRHVQHVLLVNVPVPRGR